MGKLKKIPRVVTSRRLDVAERYLNLLQSEFESQTKTLNYIVESYEERKAIVSENADITPKREFRLLMHFGPN